MKAKLNNSIIFKAVHQIFRSLRKYFTLGTQENLERLDFCTFEFILKAQHLTSVLEYKLLKY